MHTIFTKTNLYQNHFTKLSYHERVRHKIHFEGILQLAKIFHLSSNPYSMKWKRNISATAMDFWRNQSLPNCLFFIKTISIKWKQTKLQCLVISNVFIHISIIIFLIFQYIYAKIKINCFQFRYYPHSMQTKLQNIQNKFKPWASNTQWKLWRVLFSKSKNS